MHYYRYKEDTMVLAREFGDRFTKKPELIEFIKEKYKLVQLGLFTGITRHGFTVGKSHGSSTLDSEFPAAGLAMDFLVNEGPYEDMFTYQEGVFLFGRMKDGAISQVVALNQGALVEPDEVT